MKKFLLTLAAMAVATSALMAQTTTTSVVEEPDRIQMKSLSKDPSGQGIPTGYEMPQAVAQKKHECKDHKDGQPCTKPADQQCDDCKNAAGQKNAPKKVQGMKIAGSKKTSLQNSSSKEPVKISEKKK